MDDRSRKDDRARRARERRRVGTQAEQQALARLEAAGLTLVARNYRCRAGEIDLVMLEGTTLVLVEVRYRSSFEFGGAAASVTWRKQHRLANAARHLLLARPELQRYPARFDVVAVSPAAGGPQLEWIRHAFES